MVTRRQFIAQGVAIGAAAFALPRFALAAKDTDRRFVFVIQRGAMDGLAAVPPYADPDYRELRGSLALPSPGSADGILDLNGFFGLNPALQPFQRYWQSRQLLVLHAVATPYRDRSHFDGQDVLENGATSSLSRQDGWLNRAVALYGGDSAKFALAAGQQVPLVLRGKAEVGSWAPARIRQLPEGFVRALAASYGQDKLFRMALEDGVQENAFVEATLGNQMQKPLPAPTGGQVQKVRADRAFVDMATSVAKLLAAPDGPRVAVLEIGGWDTHVGQGTTTGRLANALATLSEGLDSLSQAMIPVWGKTVIMTSTEFGRTARPNGTGGTDHGTASAAFLLGGAVNGGRVLANWPEMGSGRLYENRDLAPTTDLRAVFKAVLKEHMGLPESDLDRTVFPESTPVQPLEGIVIA